MALPGGRRPAVVALTWALFASLCLLHVAHAAFIVETNALHIMGAPGIDGDYQAAIGNFGVPQYGGRLRGTVVYPDANQDGCQIFPGDGHTYSPQRGVSQIVMLNRGGCYFTQKIFNAQQAGASAVLVVDDRDEPLITMDTPADEYLPNITIPSAFIQLSLGKKIREAIQTGKMVQVSLEWDLPHPDNRVEWELWVNSNQACGPKCDAQLDFIKSFNAVASSLEQGKFTEFTPHYITWYCPAEYLGTLPCDKQCIRHGRYCTPDPDGDFEAGYDGKDVVLENLRQLCVFQIAKDAVHMPWLWWSYVNDFNDRCKMTELNFNSSCAEEVIRAIGLDVAAVNACIGDPNLDEELDLLNKEQDAQVGKDGRSDVTILPTIVINQHQYRGQLDKLPVQKAICAGFSETTEPPACLTPDIQTNDCEINNGGCWSGFNFTACKDTFRGKVCECPTVGPYTFRGDGYSMCEPVTGTRCELNNGGCWSFSQGNTTWSACKPEAYAGCECPSGFQGDGVNCNDINECETMCRCRDCKCENTIGSFMCSCKSGAVYHRSSDTCGSDSGGMGAVGVTAIVLACLAVLAGAGYVVYKYRLRQYMDSEIRAIMSQYMPLDAENQPANTATRGEGQPLNNI
eukprot:jgi/Chlat1/4521/Chrsp29S04587